MEPQPGDGEDRLFAHFQQIHQSFTNDNQSSSNLIIEGILTGDMASVKQGVELAPEHIVSRSACGAYPLHLACLLGALRIAEYLILVMEKSALFETNEGVLPLHAAAFSGQHELCEVLVEANLASSGMKTHSGHLPEDVARLAGHAELADWLTAARSEYITILETAGDTITTDNITTSTIHTTINTTIDTATNDSAALVSATTSTKSSTKSSPHKPSSVRSIAAKYTTPPRSPSSPTARAHINIVTARPSPVYASSSDENAADIVDSDKYSSDVSAAHNTDHTHTNTSTINDQSNNHTDTDNPIPTLDTPATPTHLTNTTNTSHTTHTIITTNTTNTSNAQNYLFEEFQRASLLEEENDTPGTHHHLYHNNHNNHNPTHHTTHHTTTTDTTNTTNTNNTNNNYHMYNNYHNTNYNINNNTNHITFNDNGSTTDGNIGMPESLMFNLSDVLSVNAIEQRPYTTTRVNRVTPVELPPTKPIQKSSFLFKPVSQKMDKLAHVMRLNVNSKATIKNIYSPKMLGTGREGRPGTSGTGIGTSGNSTSGSGGGGSGKGGNGSSGSGAVDYAVAPIGGSTDVCYTHPDNVHYSSPDYVHSTSQVGSIDNTHPSAVIDNASIVITTASVKASPNARNRILTPRGNTNIGGNDGSGGSGSSGSGSGGSGNGSNDAGNSGDDGTTYVVHSGKGVTYVSPRSTAAGHTPRTPRNTQAMLSSGSVQLKAVPVHTLSDTFANPSDTDTTHTAMHTSPRHATIKEDDDVVREIVRPAPHAVHTVPPLLQPTLPSTLPISTVPLPHGHQPNTYATYSVHNINHTTPISTNIHNTTTHTTNTTDVVWASSQEPMYSLHKPKRPVSSSAHKRASAAMNTSKVSGTGVVKTNVSNTTGASSTDKTTPTTNNNNSTNNNNTSTRAPTRPNTSHTARTTTATTLSPRGQRTRSADAVDVLHTRALVPTITTDMTTDANTVSAGVDANTFNTTHAADITNTSSVQTNKEKVIIPRLNIGDGFTSNHNTFDLSTLLQPYIGNDSGSRTVNTPNHYYYNTHNTAHYTNNTNNALNTNTSNTVNNHSYNHNLYNTITSGTNTSIHSAFVPSPIFRSKHNNDLLQSPAYKQRINLSQMVLTTERIVSDPHYTPPILPLPLLNTNTTATTPNTTHTLHTPRSARYEMYTEFSYIPSPRRPKTANNTHTTLSVNMQNSVSIVVPSIYTVDNTYDENNVDTKSADYST